MYRGEIYLAVLPGVGSEQSGERPVIILQNNIGNLHSPTTIIAPLTAKHKPKLPTHILLTQKDCGIKLDSTVLLEQQRCIDKTRLKRKLGELKNRDRLNELNHKLMISLGILEE